jgi:uncharacterized protein DUF4252
MKFRSLLPAALLAGALCAQQLKINLDHLAAKASDSVDLSLNGSTLQFAAKFLDSKDPEEAQVKKVIAGIEGIYIKSFEFKKDGEWTQGDLDSIRTQLRAPQWARILGVKSSGDSDNAELYLRTEEKKITGVVILFSGRRELTVVNIVGPVDLEALASLSGHLGVPKLELPKK